MRLQAVKSRGFLPEEIPDVWDRYKGMIKAALDKGSDYTLNDIYEGLLNCDMQLWAYGKDAALVTTLQNHDKKRWCLMLAIGGSKMNEWLNLLAPLESWARSKGCHEMRIYGRPGWLRVLKSAGYNAQWTKLSKRL